MSATIQAKGNTEPPQSAVYRVIALTAFLIVIVISDAASVAAPQQPSGIEHAGNQGIVKEFFPQKLRDKNSNRRNNSHEFSAFMLADLDNNGSQDYIIAAYTNGIDAAIRVLHKHENGASLVDEPILPLLKGVFPRVMVEHLDKGPRPEVIASFSTNGGSWSDWVFKWDGRKLHLVGPTDRNEDGDVESILTDAFFLDLDGDGIKEIVTASWDDPGGPLKVYKLDGAFVTSFEFFDTISISEKGRKTETRTFEVTNHNTAYSLTVINGEWKSDASDHVDGVKVVLNGKVVVWPVQVNKTVSKFTVPVDLTDTNTISIDVEGQRKGFINIVIEPETKQQ